MTVAELIEQLRLLPPLSDVRIETPHFGAPLAAVYEDDFIDNQVLLDTEPLPASVKFQAPRRGA